MRVFRVFLLLCIYTFLDANSLKYEQSPYLLQHQNNPLEWMAWNSKTLKKAKDEDKLIFLSIGYSTCHWCHVMQEESFSQQDVANVLNKDFISIKVDREEMPQLDSYYQHIFSVMHNRSGGWPLSIMMTPDKKVFFSATYLREEQLIDIARKFASIYKNDKKSLDAVALEIEQMLKKDTGVFVKHRDLKLDVMIESFISNLYENFDKKYGGFGYSRKFPMATTLDVMLNLYKLKPDKRLSQMIKKTLDSMAYGGIYDQIEGGFFRYTIDRNYQTPHFEKMLYTQAELLKVYAKAYSIFHDKLYARVVDELVDMVDKRFLNGNLFYSASDADSINEDGKKEEGYYFLFSYDKTLNYLHSKGYLKKQIKDVLAYFHIQEEGNMDDELTQPFITKGSSLYDLSKFKKDLTLLRSKNSYPFVDKKVQTSWNALYISGVFKASVVDKIYGKKALKYLDALNMQMIDKGVLYHQKISGKPMKIKGLFEDYSFLITANIDAYNFSLDDKYLFMAQHLTKVTIKKFYKDGDFYLSDDGFDVRAKVYDSGYKSALSNMLENLFKMSLYMDKREYSKISLKILRKNFQTLQQNQLYKASLFNVYLASKMGYVILKSKKRNLLKNLKKIEKTTYPFLLLKTNNEEIYLVCTANSCFAYSDDINEVLSKIESR